MKDFVNKILNVPKLIFRLWIILWACLVILLVMKFCFGIWYPIVVDNPFLINANNWIISTWFKYVFLGIFYFISLNLLYLISCKKKVYNNLLEAIITNVLILICFVTKCFSRTFSFIPESVVLIIIPAFYLFRTYKTSNKFKLILYLIVVQAIIMIWQLNIYLVRGINFDIADDEYFLIGFILQIDYYIFLLITFLEVNYMSLWGIWFFGKDSTTLKAEKEKELLKSNPNMKKVQSLEIQIARLEKEGK